MKHVSQEIIRDIVNILINGSAGKILMSNGGKSLLWATPSGGVSGAMVEVAITGTKNGVNKTFTLSEEVTEPALFFINGARIRTSHYTIGGTTLVLGASIPAPISSTDLQLLGTPV